MTKNYDVWKLRLDLGKRADRIGVEQTLETWQAMVLKVGHTEAEKWFTKAVEHKMVLQHATPNLWPFGMKWFALLVSTIIVLHGAAPGPLAHFHGTFLDLAAICVQPPKVCWWPHWPLLK